MKFLSFTALIFSLVFRVYSQNTLSPEQIYEKVNNSVVIIFAYSLKGDIYQGSGVVVPSLSQNETNKPIQERLIVTTHHIIKDAVKIEVKHYSRIFDNVDIIESDENKDILILRVKDFDLQPITMGSSTNLKHGQRIYAIGSPEGFENTISEGIISGFRQIESSVNVIQMTTPITEGSSGGAVVNDKGELIGLSLSGQHEGNIYFAIPVNDILPLLNKVYASLNDSLNKVYADTSYKDIVINETDSTAELTNDTLVQNENHITPDYTDNISSEDTEGNNKIDTEKTNSFVNSDTGSQENKTETEKEKDSYIIKANYAYEHEDYKLAVYYFTKHLEKNSNDETAYFRRGCAHIKLKENSKAITDFTKTLEKNPLNFESYFYRGNVYYSIRNYEKALNDYTEAIKLSPESSVLYYNRGLTYYKLEKYQNAVKDWETAISLNESYSKELNDIILKTKKLINEE